MRSFTEELRRGRARTRAAPPLSTSEPETSAPRLFGDRSQRKVAREALRERLRGRELVPGKPAVETRAARRAEAAPALQRDRAANERWAKRALERWEPLLDARERGGLAFELRLIPRDVWRTCWRIVGDPSGAAARAAWRGVAPLLRIRMLRAALGMYGREFARYRWSDIRARRICALAFALYSLSKQGTRRGRWSGGIVVGVTRRALCQLLRDPHDTRESATPTVSALAGTHRVGATAESGEVGYMLALKAAGFCYSQKVSTRDNALPCERWGAWCSARYWLAAGVYERVLAELGVDGGAFLEFSAAWIHDGLDTALRRLFAIPPPLAPA